MSVLPAIPFAPYVAETMVDAIALIPPSEEADLDCDEDPRSAAEVCHHNNQLLLRVARLVYKQELHSAWVARLSQFGTAPFASVECSVCRLAGVSGTFVLDNRRAARFAVANYSMPHEVDLMLWSVVQTEQFWNLELAYHNTHHSGVRESAQQRTLARLHRATSEPEFFLGPFERPIQPPARLLAAWEESIALAEPALVDELCVALFTPAPTVQREPASPSGDFLGIPGTPT